MKHRIVLASTSPRRRQLLDLIGLPHTVVASGVDEEPGPAEAATSFALRAAHEKAAAVASGHPDRPVIAADTVVEIAGKILGKPRSETEAVAMLAGLSGARHHVHTAVAMAFGGRCPGLVDTAAVRFRTLSQEMIRWYVATGEPMDKAGAYAIQGIGGLFVSGVSGSPHTVVGLPIHRLADLFTACGLDLWAVLNPRA